MRQRIEVGETFLSYARGNRLHANNVDRTAAVVKVNGGGNPPEYSPRKCSSFDDERHHPRLPPYASMSPLCSVKGSLRRPSPVLDPAMRFRASEKKDLTYFL